MSFLYISPDSETRTQIHSAVSTNNLPELKSLLSPLINVTDSMDDSTAELYMNTLSKLQTDPERDSTYLEIDEILAALSAADAGLSFSVFYCSTSNMHI